MPTVLLVRHAQGSYGTADYDVLSEVGQRQVSALVAGLERRGATLGRVISGPLRRQRETAEPVAAAAGVALTVDERWREYDDADVMGSHSTTDARVIRDPAGEQPALSSRDFQTLVNAALRAWIDAGADSPARQSWPEFSGVVLAGLHDLAADLGKGETALVVSSSGVIAVVAVALLELPATAMIAYNHVSVNTGITKLVVGRAGLSLVTFNEHVHLEEMDGRLITYR